MKISDITKQIRAFADQLEGTQSALAMPPDGRPLCNEDELTAEQVGAGFRLRIKEDVFSDDAEVWNSARKEWRKTSTRSFDPVYTYRLPLSVPWPELEKPDPFAELKAAHAAGRAIQILNSQNRYVDADPKWTSPVEYYRIKPEASPFQLPPPPPGMQWHRKDGWKAEDLPPGTRPLAYGETVIQKDEIKWSFNSPWTPMNGLVGSPANDNGEPKRTTRPLLFMHAGKSWTYHRPGDPMPCDGERKIVCIVGGNVWSDIVKGSDWEWGELLNGSIIGWRYAEPATKEVELGPEDVPPGSVIGRIDSWCMITCASNERFQMGQERGELSTNTWAEAMRYGWLINRSIPLSGKWNPDAWEKCSKEVPA